MGSQRGRPHDRDDHTIYTIGHSNRSLDEFIALLREVAIALLVDIRSLPRSLANPQFNADTLPKALATVGIQYVHIRALGGLRHRPKDAGGPSPNGMWKNTSFRNYADYATTQAFRGGLEELLALAQLRRCAIMCAEALWWRCHRRIVTDYLLAEGWTVMHILSRGQEMRATLTPGAYVQSDHTILYPVA